MAKRREVMSVDLADRVDPVHAGFLRGDLRQSTPMLRQGQVENPDVLLVFSPRDILVLRHFLQAFLGFEHWYYSTQTKRALVMFNNINTDFGGDIANR